MTPNWSRICMYNVPLGLIARARRAVSSGIVSGSGSGNDIKASPLTASKGIPLFYQIFLSLRVVWPFGNRVNIGDTRGKIAILLEARRRFDVNCLLPQCFRSLEEKSPPLDRLGSLDPQT